MKIKVLLLAYACDLLSRLFWNVSEMSGSVLVNCFSIQKLFNSMFLKFIWNLCAFDPLNLHFLLILCLSNFSFSLFMRWPFYLEILPSLYNFSCHLAYSCTDVPVSVCRFSYSTWQYSNFISEGFFLFSYLCLKAFHSL